MTTVSPSTTHLTLAIMVWPKDSAGAAKKEKKKTAARAAKKNLSSAGSAHALPLALKLFDLLLEGTQVALYLITVERLL